MENIYRLKEYYKRVCSPLVFVNETSLENNKNVKVYLYDFKTEEELSNFKKVFQEYLPFYVRNYDSISKYKISDDDEEISKMLVEKAKYIKFKSGSIPNRGVDKDGIYGEIYNDFYIRNIIDKDRLISYLSRRSYERVMDIVFEEDKERHNHGGGIQLLTHNKISRIDLTEGRHL